MKELQIVSCKNCKFYNEKNINKSSKLCFCKYQKSEFKANEPQLSSDIKCFRSK